MSGHLRINTLGEHDQELQRLLAQQAKIQARIASLLPSSTSPSTHAPHRSPIHKQQQQRRGNVSRSMSSNGTTEMARHNSSSNRIEAQPLRRSSSQRSAPSTMARQTSRGTSSQHNGNLPFTQTGAMPPPLNSEPRRDNPAITAWTEQEQPLSSYTFSHQSQRSPHSQRNFLEQVPEVEHRLDNIGETPGDYISRTTGIMACAMPIPSTSNSHRLSASSFTMQTPTTPMSESLTTASTITSNMSRQNSLCNEPFLESIQMMKFHSNTSLSTDFNDQSIFDQVPHFTSSHSRRSSNEEQAKLLVGAGANHESLFPHSFSLPSSGSFGEKMEKSQSSQSNISSSSSSSRNRERLQAQINLAVVRPLMPKGGSENTLMSRENSSQSLRQQDLKDGSDKVAISSKPTYQRPKHERVFCKQCEGHQEGFRGEHELRRHQQREHRLMVKKWMCIEPSSGNDHPKPVLALSKCKACNQQKKKYGAYYNAAAHLRRAHFRPKPKGRSKTAKADEGEKRGGKGGGDWPPMSELKYWMKEVEEQAPEFSLIESQQQDDASDEELDDQSDEGCSQRALPSLVSVNSFDNKFLATPSPLNDYSIPDNDIFCMPNMHLDLSPAQNTVMEQSMYSASSQSSFPNFSSNHSLFQNDQLAFFDPSLSHQSFDDQILSGPDLGNFSFQ